MEHHSHHAAVHTQGRCVAGRKSPCSCSHLGDGVLQEGSHHAAVHTQGMVHCRKDVTMQQFTPKAWYVAGRMSPCSNSHLGYGMLQEGCYHAAVHTQGMVHCRKDVTVQLFTPRGCCVADRVSLYILLLQGGLWWFCFMSLRVGVLPRYIF